MHQNRVAFFPDSYHEANGVAHTARALEAYAARRRMPLLCVHAGPRTRVIEDGYVTHVELKRSALGSFDLEHDLQFDLLFWRHARCVADALRRFEPNVLHVTGPSDVGQLGAFLGHKLNIPMVGSWHTNLHEYASRRLLKRFARLSEARRMAMRLRVERQTLRATLQFYRIPRVILAPNEDLHELLSRRLGKPTYLISRGVDADLFTPAKRTRMAAGEDVNIGFVGRLSPEISVRVFERVEDALVRDGVSRFYLTIVGDGSELEWMRAHLVRARFPGILLGDALARAYANMDLFVFPSETETVGNAVLEAMASGVPVVAMARGGPKFIAADPASAVLARNTAELTAAAVALVRDPARRRSMGLAARQRAVALSWDTIFDRVSEVYASVAREGQRRVPDVRPTPAPNCDGDGVPHAH